MPEIYDQISTLDYSETLSIFFIKPTTHNTNLKQLRIIIQFCLEDFNLTSGERKRRVSS